MFKTIIITAVFLLLTPLSSLAEPIVIEDYPIDKISPSVYVIHGPTTVPNEFNQGFMNNPGIVMTSKGVVVIDPGSVIEAGEMVLRVIKKMTHLPVIAVFNTHVHADHWFGNDAITKAYPNIPIYAHQVTIDEANEIGQAWINTLRNLTHSNKHKNTIKTANTSVNNGDVINIGDTSFKIYHDAVTHTHSDIMIAVNGDEAIFLGDNLFNGRLNPHEDGHIKKTWESVEKVVEITQAKVIVPGHGKSGGRSMLAFALKAHKLLYQSVQTQFEEDVSDFEMRPMVEPVMGDYKHWDAFDSQLGKVINKAFLEIEEAEF